MELSVGSLVRKISGYPFLGVIVSDFNNLNGNRRLVVECTAPDVAGCLHIYNENQLAIQMDHLVSDCLCKVCGKAAKLSVCRARKVYTPPTTVNIVDGGGLGRLFGDGALPQILPLLKKWACDLEWDSVEKTWKLNEKTEQA
jgi:hypothetical protein